MTPDDKAIEIIVNDFLEAAATGNNPTIMSMLEKGMPINCQNQYNTTALHLATTNGQEDTVMLLLKEGADKTLRNSNGRTALDISEDLLFDGISLLFMGDGECPWTP
jgi:ankyrin repeat protein